MYVYSKQVSSPMLTYQYNSARGLLVSGPGLHCSAHSTVSLLLSQPSSAAGEAGQPPEPNEFVSAVSWRSNSNVLLAANSQGHIKVTSALLNSLPAQSLLVCLCLNMLQVLEMC